MIRILVVEDEPSIALGLEIDLRTEGYHPELAADGIEAAGRARAEPFDLILLDVMLPGKDGFEVCRELRRAGVSTPIIVFTAKTHDAEKIIGLDFALVHHYQITAIFTSQIKVVNNHHDSQVQFLIQLLDEVQNLHLV